LESLYILALISCFTLTRRYDYNYLLEAFLMAWWWWSVYQTVGSVVHNKRLSRHESVIINRLRIGHSRLTHSYLSSGDDQPTCSTCGHPLTVHHILLDCVDLQDVRRRQISKICLKPSTIVLLLILSKKSVFTAYCGISSYICR